jgi:hypothetical protein
MSIDVHYELRELPGCLAGRVVLRHTNSYNIQWVTIGRKVDQRHRWDFDGEGLVGVEWRHLSAIAVVHSPARKGPHQEWDNQEERRTNPA